MPPLPAQEDEQDFECEITPDDGPPPGIWTNEHGAAWLRDDGVHAWIRVDA